MVEFTLVFAALTGVLFAWAGTRLWNRDMPDHVTDKLIGAAAGGLIVGRVTAMLAQGTNPLSHPADILLIRGGVNTASAALGAISVYLWSVRGRIDYLDAIAPAGLLGLAGWHAGCLWRGACLGTVTGLPWGWSVPSSSIGRHPVEIYAALGLVAGAIIVSRLSKRPLTRSGAALIMVSLVLLTTEPFRLTLAGGPWPWYAAGIIVGFAMVFVGRRFSFPTRLNPT